MQSWLCNASAICSLRAAMWVRAPFVALLSFHRLLANLRLHSEIAIFPPITS
jgi:hypothetical protein